VCEEIIKNFNGFILNDEGFDDASTPHGHPRELIEQLNTLLGLEN